MDRGPLFVIRWRFIYSSIQMSRFDYLRRSLANQFSKSRLSCPNCGSMESRLVQRKYLVTQLRRCGKCGLLYRTPTDDPGLNQTFYESDYAQGFTTEMPSDRELTRLKESLFAGTEKDYSYYTRVLKDLGLPQGAHIFDYGCSWGYGSYQFSSAGFEVVSFEIAPTRKEYARQKLGVHVVNDMETACVTMAGKFDCFFSAHVLEHVPSPAQAMKYALRLLRTGGIFVSFTPNGSSEHQAASVDWKKLWGEVHPNFLDDQFLNKAFSKSPRSVGSSPVTNASLPKDASLRRVNSLDSSELFFAARKSADTWG